MSTINWTCDVCRRPIDNTTACAGVIELPPVNELTDIEEAREAWAERSASGTATVLAHILELPQPAHWRIAHTECSDRSNSTAYDIDLHEIRTHADLLEWTAHLLSKTWVKHTDWTQLIRRVIAEPDAKETR